MRRAFLHAADIHLDTPFRGMSAAVPEIADALRDASLQAFDNLINLAIDRDVAFVVLAGDIYDGDTRGVRAQLRFAAGLERLHAALIPCFIVHGNHDPLGSGWNAIGKFPDNTHVFSSDGPESKVVERDGKHVATVHGMSFSQREVSENLAKRFARPTSPGLHVGVLHANVGGDPNHGNYAPCKLSDLSEVGFDYWALGHVHTRQVWREGKSTIAYSGNLQGRSPKPSELGAKGAFLVPFDGATVGELEFVACDVARFVESEIDCSTLTNVAQVVSAAEQAVSKLQSEHVGRALVVRLRLVGRSAAHIGLAKPDAIYDVCEAIRESFVADSPFVWIDSLIDRTAAERNVIDLRSRGDFVSEALDSLSAFDDEAKRAAFIHDVVSSLSARVPNLGTVAHAIELANGEADEMGLSDDLISISHLIESALTSQQERIESTLCDLLVGES